MTSSALAERPTERQQLRVGLQNVRLWVHRTDFAGLRCGERPVFRSYKVRPIRDLPRPVIVCSAHPATGRVDTALSLLVDQWVHPLGTISDEEVAEEGFASRGEYKRYFAERYPRWGWRPLENVMAFRLRPLTDDDRQAWLDRVWERLYGSFA